MDLSQDLRDALAEFAEPVTLTGGAVVMAAPSVASSQDALGGETIVAGRTRVLRFVTADIPDLVPGNSLTWAGKTWRVINIQLAAMGQLSRVFLGSSA